MSAGGRDLIQKALAEGRTSLDEREAKLLLAMYGVPTPAGAVVHDAQRAAEVVEALGGSAALKALGPDIQHKSDLGLVELDVRGAAAARAAFHRIVDRAAGRATGVLVEEFVPHERELLVGMRRDEHFGAVVAFGLGGIFTEPVGDVALALAPLDDGDADALAAGIRARRLLEPVRGLPRVDMDLLRAIIRSVARLADDHPEITEIDVNPLLVVGDHLVAADALVIVSDAGPAERPARAARRLDLDAVFSPRSVAVVGASDDETKWGGSVLRNLVGGGYAGEVYPVNPKAETIMGLPAFATSADLPATPDLVICALGSEAATPVIEECGRRGVPAAIVIAAGFAETGPEGAAMQEELARAADAGAVTLIGPNCMGALCTSANLNAVGFVTLAPEPGRLSVVSQSGNIGTQLLLTAARRGVGVEKYVSSGNQAVTDATDILEYLIGDRRTGVIAAYLEGLEDGRRFYELARGAAARKPIVVMRGGLSALGRMAASSHTGALAGSAEVFRAAAGQAGVVLAADPDEALDVCALFAYQPLPAGRRVAVVTLGGGWGVLTADLLAQQGLELAELPAATIAAIGELLPRFWSRGNPVDLVATVADGVPERVIELVADCDCVDSVITLALVGSPSSGRAMLGDVPKSRTSQSDPVAGLNESERRLLTHVASVTGRTGKPIIGVPLVPVERSVFPGLGAFAPVLLPSPTAAVRALARATWYATHPTRRGLASRKVP